MTEKKETQAVGMVQTAVDLGIYTPLSVAKEEIWRRWNDKELKKKVEDFLGEDIPEIFRKEPTSALFRFIATPNFEFKYFLDVSKIFDLNPVYVELLDDSFCTRNQDKISLGKLALLDGKNKKKKIKIIDLQSNDNKKFLNIKTLWGEGLIDFHHRIFDQYYKNIDRFDASQFKKNGEHARDVYVKFLSLFVCHGILFENYIVKDNSYEKKFTNSVVLPAFREISERFKIKPLIVPLLPIKDEERDDWMWYPGQLETQVGDLVSLNKKQK